MALFFSEHLLRELTIYSKSSRAITRRKRRPHEHRAICDEYLFLTKMGRPYYLSDRDPIGDSYDNRPTGNAISQFIRQTLMPRLVQEGFNRKFSFHDLRATFGVRFMEWEVKNRRQENSGEAPQDAFFHSLNKMKNRMGHSDVRTSEGYLNYVLEYSREDFTQESYERHLFGIDDESIK